ncbi:MAG: asparagine synthase (glutamine-hydrolyzing) [Bacteroidetes bacterium GWE2_29_8]|nr:MAG: asparagine synthase (glutamine-hydrolyzing) [Bacteroidetes bacterium GWE2_29_8]
MCGISGIYYKNGTSISEEIKLMNKVLTHRGPDAEGYYIESPIALGHKRLSIIDLSNSANQPMHSKCDNYVIVYNGEVFNFEDIKKDLNITTSTTSDTEVIIEAFIKEGVNFVNRLNGMFAIAIYDKIKQDLYLFRDRIGIKPIYFYNDSNIFAFASEIKSLLQINLIKQQVSLNKNSIPSYLFMGFAPSESTFYNNINKLLPGHFAIINKSELSTTSYWNINEKLNKNYHSNFNTTKEELKNLIESSVKYRLIADVPLGTFLSGGIDSSLITAVASKYSNTKLKTFTIGFQESEYNEAHFAKKIAKHLNTEHYEYIISENSLLEYIDKLNDIYDEPFPDSSSLPSLIISKLARQNVTTILSGEGGDELFYGYGSYIWAKRLDNNLLRFASPYLSSILSNFGSRYQRVAKLLNYYSKQTLNQHIFSQEQYYFSLDELQLLLSDDFKKELNKYILGQNDNEIITDKHLSLLEKQSFFDLQNYLPNDLLVKYDRATMFNSLEGRVPLLDYRVVEYAINIDPKLKLQGNNAKYILKEILYDYLPKELFDRPKWGFSIPLKYWLNNKLRFLIDENLNKKTIEEAGIVNFNYVSKLIKEYQAGKVFLYNRIWLLILLHKWIKEKQI